MTGVAIGLGMAIATPFMLPARSVVNIAATLPPSESLIPISPGSLRVSNQTYHPIRVALLPQISSAGPSPLTSSPTTPSPTTPSPQYGDPLHWDFVPREGHAHGLVLAIPEGHVQIQPGDVLTAFAQDGSRRYWGPYVVGVTDSPIWDQDTQEWSLVLETPFPY